jgi:hypothetical protein
MIKIIAFDPGITTGYAQGILKDDIDEPMYVTTGEGKWSHMDLWKFCNGYTPNFIIYERFLARHSRYRQGVELKSREMIGVLELYCEMYASSVVLQNPMKGGKSSTFDNVNSSYFNDERLKKDAIYKSGKPHANDAARHLLYWYWFGSGGQFDSRRRGYKTGVLM